MARDWPIAEILIVLAIFALLYAIVRGAQKREKVEMPAAYAAWSKHTGNPNELTYEEWRSLMKANEQQKNSAVFIVPIMR